MRYDEQQTILDEINRTEQYAAMVMHGTIYLYTTENRANTPHLTAIIRSIEDWDALQPSPETAKRQHYHLYQRRKHFDITQ